LAKFQKNAKFEFKRSYICLYSPSQNEGANFMLKSCYISKFITIIIVQGHLQASFPTALLMTSRQLLLQAKPFLKLIILPELLAPLLVVASCKYMYYLGSNCSKSNDSSDVKKQCTSNLFIHEMVISVMNKDI